MLPVLVHEVQTEHRCTPNMSDKSVLCFLFLLVNFPLLSKPTPSKGLTQKFENDENCVLVFDEVLPSRDLESFFELVTAGRVEGKVSSWFYTYGDYYQKVTTLNVSSKTPWIAPVNPEFFIKTELWNVSRKVLETISGGRTYFPYDVSFAMQRRLDFITASNAGKTSSSSADTFGIA